MAKLGARERHGMLGLLLQLGYVPIVTFVLSKSRSAPVLPTKPWSAVGFWSESRVRADPRRFAEKTVLCGILGSMLKSAQVRAEFAEEIVVRARFLGECSKQRSTGTLQCQETAVIRATTRCGEKCKFPLSKLRGEATYYTHHTVAESRFPSTSLCT